MLQLVHQAIVLPDYMGVRFYGYQTWSSYLAMLFCFQAALAKQHEKEEAEQKIL